MKFDYRLLWMTMDAAPGKLEVLCIEPGAESQGSYSMIPLSKLGEEGWDIVPGLPFNILPQRSIPSGSFLVLFKRERT